MLRYIVAALCLVTLVLAQDPGFNDTCVQGTYPPHPRTAKALCSKLSQISLHFCEYCNLWRNIWCITVFNVVSQKVKEYVINLDLPPEQRWTQLATEKSQAIVGIIMEFKKFLMEFGDGKIISLIDLLGDDLDNVLPSPYREEIAGIAKASGVYEGELFIYNVFYELFTVCTSIVAQDAAGKMYHARNLDFGLFLGWDPKNRTWELTTALRPAIVNLDWQRGGKTVFKSVNYAGYVGILTAIKPNKFTFSMDERFNADGGYLGILEWIRDKKGSWMGFLSRETMENANSFDEARDKLANTQMIAPAYFILGGTTPGQGVVITRNREVNGTDIWPMTDKLAGGWYVLETNYDHWKQPLFLDDRRDPANKCMQKMTVQNAGLPALFDVLSSKPVLNKFSFALICLHYGVLGANTPVAHSLSDDFTNLNQISDAKLTTYTALMQVDSGHLESWLRYCPDPCEPW